MAAEAQWILRALPLVPKDASFIGIKAPLMVIRESLMSNPVVMRSKQMVMMSNHMAMMLNQNQITLTPGENNGSRVIDGSESMPHDLH